MTGMTSGEICLPDCKHSGEYNVDSVASVRCCLCMRYYHLECHNVSKKEIKNIWNCYTCRNLPSSVETMLLLVRDLSQDFMKLSLSSLNREKDLVDCEMKLQTVRKEVDKKELLIRDLELKVATLTETLAQQIPIFSPKVLDKKSPVSPPPPPSYASVAAASLDNSWNDGWDAAAVDPPASVCDDQNANSTPFVHISFDEKDLTDELKKYILPGPSNVEDETKHSMLESLEEGEQWKMVSYGKKSRTFQNSKLNMTKQVSKVSQPSSKAASKIAPNSKHEVVIGEDDSNILSTVSRPPKRSTDRGIFLSRLGPDETETSVKNYVQVKCNRNINVRKLITKHPGYSSFHIECSREDLQGLLSPKMWPRNALVKRFYAPRHTDKQPITDVPHGNLIDFKSD